MRLSAFSAIITSRKTIIPFKPLQIGGTLDDEEYFDPIRLFAQHWISFHRIEI